MKRLTLMRHGHAQWKDAGIADSERALNRRGAAEAEAMARRLAELKLIPDLIIASPARRAQQTADIMVRGLALAARQLRFEEPLYLARAPDILQTVRETGPLVRHLMVIGHNPGISELARLLAPENGLGELMTAAVCSITFDTHEWRGAGAPVVREVRHENPPPRLFSLWA